MTIRSFFFQIVLFLAGAVMTMGAAILRKELLSRIAAILGVLLIIFALLWAGYELGGSEPQLTPTPTAFSMPTATLPDTSPRVIATPTNFTSPEQFVREYFDLLNQRRYEEAWSKLSASFQGSFANKGTNAFSEYLSFWATVDKVEITSMTIKSQSTNYVLIYVESNYHYSDGHTTAAHTTYKLVRNLPDSSWRFDPN